MIFPLILSPLLALTTALSDYSPWAEDIFSTVWIGDLSFWQHHWPNIPDFLS
ncbi:hypothetical protein SEHO0A_00506 [Salmonella enterica subsp. houtenae str. ATCC BAA-1581]|nr:hypothetical protein SEHO0A_00506 [Salmonella enterica subsp. houtenae str. ATCC BAA-1581]